MLVQHSRFYAHQFSKDHCNSNIFSKSTQTMKYSVISIVFIVSFCRADNLVCQLFNETSKSLEKYCEWYNGELPKNCSSESAQMEPSEVKHLKIGGCGRLTVSNLIVNHKNIESLDISYSGHEHLEWLNFKLKYLKKLNASNNILSYIPRHLLKKAPELVEIDLSHNKVPKIEENDFKSGEELRKIHLSHNELEHLNEEALASVEYLEFIDLRSNRFSDIPVFPLNKQLKTIHLEGNPIRDFNCSFLSSKSPASVFLSWKNVVSFSGDPNCNEKRIYVISSSKHDGILTTSNGHHKLLCNGESFTSLNYFTAGQNAFKNAGELLKCFSDVRSIDLSGNFITELNATTFKKFYFLERLNLSYTMLTNFDANVLQSPSKLKSLDISYNQLKGVQSISVVNFLKEFNVAGNNLQNTPEIVQKLASSVEILNLSGNFVGKLNTAMFKRFVALKKLQLSNTSLSFSDGDPFQPLQTLSSLDISHNNLTNLNFTLLTKTLSRLEELSVGGSQIKNVSQVIQHLGSSTKKLDLSGNFVGNLSGNGFERLNNLEDLNLSNVNLSYFDSATSLSSALKQLNLEGNDLIEIDELKRSHFANLGSLAISNNRIPCGKLEQLIQDFEGVHFIGDPFEQKHGDNCRVDYANVTIGIAIAITVSFIIVCICLICWNRFIKPFQTISSVS